MKLVILWDSHCNYLVGMFSTRDKMLAFREAVVKLYPDSDKYLQDFEEDVDPIFNPETHLEKE